MRARWSRKGPHGELFSNPRHPYTVGLLRCLPERGRRKSDGPLDTIPGSLASPGAAISGCVFADRCSAGGRDLQSDLPPFFDLGRAAFSRCHYHDQPVVRGQRRQSAVATLRAGQQVRTRCWRSTNLSKTYSPGARAPGAADSIDLTLAPGETLGLVGESGSGKTTFARLLLGLLAAG